jgi:hypothetical protein
MLGLDDGQSLMAVLGLQQSVAFITQERYEDFAVRREVVGLEFPILRLNAGLRQRYAAPDV